MWVINPHMSYLEECPTAKFSTPDMYVPNTAVVTATNFDQQNDLSGNVQLSTISNVYADLEKTDEEIQLMNKNLYEYIDKMISVQKNLDKDDVQCTAKPEGYYQRPIDISSNANVLPGLKLEDSFKYVRPSAGGNLTALDICQEREHMLNAYEKFSSSLREDGVNVNSFNSSVPYGVALPKELDYSFPYNTESKPSFSNDNINQIGPIKTSYNDCREMPNNPSSSFSSYTVPTTAYSFCDNFDGVEPCFASDVKVPQPHSIYDRYPNELSCREAPVSSFRPFIRKDVSIPFLTDNSYAGYPRCCEIVPTKELPAVCHMVNYKPDPQDCERKVFGENSQGIHYSNYCSQEISRSHVQTVNDADDYSDGGDYEVEYPECCTEPTNQIDKTQTLSEDFPGDTVTNLRDSSRVQVHQEQYYQKYYQMLQAKSRNKIVLAKSQSSVDEKHLPSATYTVDASGDNLKQCEGPQNKPVDSHYSGDESAQKRNKPKRRVTILDPEQDSICQNILKRYNQYKKNIVSEIPKVEDATGNTANQSSSLNTEMTQSKEHLENSGSQTLTYGEYKKRLKGNVSSSASTNRLIDRALADSDIKKSDPRVLASSKNVLPQRIPNVDSVESKHKVNKTFNPGSKSNATKSNLDRDILSAKPMASKIPLKWNPLNSKYGRKPGREDSQDTGEVPINPYSPFCPDERVERIKPLLDLTTPARDTALTLTAKLKLRDKIKAKDPKLNRFDPNKMRETKKRKHLPEKDRKRFKKDDMKLKELTVSEPVVSSTNDLGDSVSESQSKDTVSGIDISTEPSTKLDSSKIHDNVTSSTCSLPEPSHNDVNDTVDNVEIQFQEGSLQSDNVQHSAGVVVNDSVTQIFESQNQKLETEGNEIISQVTTDKGLENNEIQNSIAVLVSNSMSEHLEPSNEEYESQDNDNQYIEENLIPEIPNQTNELKLEKREIENVDSSSTDILLKQTDTAKNSTEDGFNEDKENGKIPESDSEHKYMVTVNNDRPNTNVLDIESQKVDVSDHNVQNNNSDIDSETADFSESEISTNTVRLLDIDIQRICNYRFCKLVLLDIFWKAKRDGKFKKSRLNRLTRKFMRKYNAKLNKTKSLIKMVETAKVSLQEGHVDKSNEKDSSLDNDLVGESLDVDQSSELPKSLKSEKVKTFSDSEDEELAKNAIEEVLMNDVKVCNEDANAGVSRPETSYVDGLDEEENIKKSPNIFASRDTVINILNKCDNDLDTSSIFIEQLPVQNPNNDLNESPNNLVDEVALDDQRGIVRGVDEALLTKPGRLDANNDTLVTSETIGQLIVQKIDEFSPEYPSNLVDQEALGSQVGQIPVVEESLLECVNRKSPGTETIKSDIQTQDDDKHEKVLTRLKIQRVRLSSEATEDHYVCMKPENVPIAHEPTNDLETKHVKTLDKPKSKNRKKKRPRTEVCDNDSVESRKPKTDISKGKLVSDVDQKRESKKTDKKKPEEKSPSKNTGHKGKKRKHKEIINMEKEINEDVDLSKKCITSELGSVNVSTVLADKHVNLHQNDDVTSHSSSTSAAGLELGKPMESLDQENFTKSDNNSMLIVTSDKTEKEDSCKSVVYNIIYNLDSVGTSDLTEGSIVTSHSDATACEMSTDGLSYGSMVVLPEMDTVMSELDKSLLEIEKTPNTVIDESSDSSGDDVPFLKNIDSFLSDLDKIVTDEKESSSASHHLSESKTTNRNDDSEEGTDKPDSSNLNIVDLHSIAGKSDYMTCDIDKRPGSISYYPHHYSQDCSIKVKTKGELKQTTYDIQLFGPAKTNKKEKIKKRTKMSDSLTSTASVSSRADSEVPNDDFFVCIYCHEEFSTSKNNATEKYSKNFTMFCRVCFIESYKKRFANYKKKFKMSFKQ